MHPHRLDRQRSVEGYFYLGPPVPIFPPFRPSGSSPVQFCLVAMATTPSVWYSLGSNDAEVMAPCFPGDADDDVPVVNHRPPSGREEDALEERRHFAKSAISFVSWLPIFLRVLMAL